MGFSIQSLDSNIIEIIYSGTIGLVERLLAVEEVIELAASYDFVRLLINVKGIEMAMSVDEQEYFGRHLASRNELANAKVAVLHNPEMDPNVIINAVAFISGYHVVDFDRRDEALSWLHGNFK